MNKKKAFSEMIIHTPICTHSKASNILIIGSMDEYIQKELLKHKKESSFKFIELLDLEKIDNKTIDIVVLTNMSLDLKSLINIDRVLKNDAILVFTSASFSQDREKLRNDLKLVGEKFWIVMPFRFNHTTCILASKKYHPTADLNLQRADFIEDLEYYSTDIHIASFVFPANIHKELTGIAKR